MDQTPTTPPSDPHAQPPPLPLPESVPLPEPLPAHPDVVWITTPAIAMDAAPSHVSPPEPRPPDQAAPIADPWAHRRGEPRLFAFFWLIYILIAIVGSVLWVSQVTIVSASSFSPAARIMLVVVAVGATILWPMVRLSQASPRARAISHVFADTLVVLFPIQLIVWPLVVLAAWPFTIVLAIAATLAAWVALCGGLLAIALSGQPAVRPGDASLAARSFWMIVILLCVCAAPLIGLAFQAARAPMPSWLSMLSPLTAIPMISGTGMSGPQNPVTPLEIQLIVSTAILAAAFWAVAGVRSLLGNRAEAA